jgi:hypothetical protein
LFYATCFDERDYSTKILVAKNFVHHASKAMHVLLADLDEDAAGFGE